MKTPLRFPFLAAIFAAALTALALAGVAQSALADLPKAPAADRASIGGTTAAAASLPGPGHNPLEPYLVSWLLPVGGLLSVIVAVFADKRVKASIASRPPTSGISSTRPL